ncbi:hypothetical protein [Marinospirillum sp.]|uniref:hypothetical protein n=1 Tax=Marinospirillum sp. TaxID=2183934 RepID=UPI003A87EBA4
MMKYLAYIIAGCLSWPILAQAHYPVMDCQKNQADISCRIGFSDGTFAPGSEVVMYTYEDQVIARAVADGSSTAHFTWQEGDFYIQFDAGHEDPAEFDSAELE